MDLILNWLWQGVVVAIATGAVLRVMQPARARDRYLVLWVSLAAVLLLPAVAFLAALGPGPLEEAALPATGLLPAAEGAVVTMPDVWWTSGGAVAALWALWSCTFALRAARDVLVLRSARRRGRPLPREVEERLPCWARVRSGGRRASLVLSGRVRAAAILGCGSPPTIAIAPALLMHLSEEELDRVVIHEWAHVQRRDDVANAVQVVVRILAGWHPAVWWLDRRLHLERELACDEAVVAVTQGAKAYAACLAKVAGLPAAPLPWRGMPAFSPSNLRHRIVRILALSPARATGSWRAASLCAGIFVCVLAAGTGGVRLVQGASPSRGGGEASAPDAGVPSPAEASWMGNAAASGAEANWPIGPSALPAPGAPPIMPRPLDAAVLRERRAPAGRLAAAPAGATAARPAPGVAGPVVLAARQPVLSSLAGAPVPPASAPPVRGAGASRERAAAPLSDGSDEEAPEAASPWRAAADGGVAVGRGSQKAAVATAGFFGKFGKRIASAF